MKHIFSTLVLSLLLGAIAMPMSAQVVSNDNEDEVNKVNVQAAQMDYREGEVLVKFKANSAIKVTRQKSGKFLSSGVSSVDALFKQLGAEEVEELMPRTGAKMSARRVKSFAGTEVKDKDLGKLYRLRLNSDKAMSVHEVIEQLEASSEVEFAEPNYKAYIMSDDEDYALEPLFSQLWGVSAINMPNLWRMPKITEKRPVIAILDTGIDITHPDLAANIWTNNREAEGEEGYDNDNNGFKNDVHGWDFINQTGNIRDFNGHGTHCAGIAAAIGDNQLGIVGANPDALIMPITIMQSDGTGDLATIIKGIDYAVAMGADVLSMSIGTYASSAAFKEALGKAYQTAILVAAAGNDGLCLNHAHREKGQMAPMPMFPAAYNFVLGVQASAKSGTMAGFSNYDDDGAFFSAYGEEELYNYELRAPGASILSLWPGGNYRSLNGTSMACPLVAGALSRLIQCKEVDSKEELFGDLIHSTTLVGDLDIYQAYQMTDENRNPSLSIVTYTIDDSEGDGDGLIDAGETIAIYPTLRNDWGQATNIRVGIDLGDMEDPNIVELLDNNVTFGSNLSSYAKNKALTPLRLKISETCADNRHIKLKIVATCDESNTTYEWPFTILVVNMVKISGLITENTTLTSNQTFYVNDHLAISDEATLVIEPGARLEFEKNKTILAEGQLIAKGTPESPIILKVRNGGWWSLKEKRNFDINEYRGFYMNADTTKFSFLPTDETPIHVSDGKLYLNGDLYYSGELSPEASSRNLLETPIDKYYGVHIYNDYIMNQYQDKLDDSDFWSPIFLHAINELKDIRDDYNNTYSPETPSSFKQYIRFGSSPGYKDEGGKWYIIKNPVDTLSYCYLEGFSSSNPYNGFYEPLFIDCTFKNSTLSTGSSGWTFGSRNTINESTVSNGVSYGGILNTTESNIVNSQVPTGDQTLFWSSINNNNIFNLKSKYYLGRPSKEIRVEKNEKPSYLGTAREDLIRPFIYEMGNTTDQVYAQVDLSNMLTQPVRAAHGIVWKVIVNGYDAQDEFEQLPPLGVGRHKFEVYFNRPMNKEVVPQISFGVREPYTQQVVAEDGSWNEEGTIYTAYKTISGKTKSDGLNRIYVYGAEDDEFFEIPYEKTRFNINIQAAGSMATGFAAEAGLGRVNLTWNNDENNFEDAMGFNVYRYTTSPNPSQGGESVNDTIRINQDIVDIEATSYIDYDVKPGETYYYYYKVLSTDLQEYDVSNVVAVTPLTGELGDANGSGDVDVADVITTVNYAAGQQPKPFIFEAADMNVDLSIDILDVIGIIKKILNPDAEVKPSIFSTATYTIEDGILYVESPVALAGVQVQLATEEDQTISVCDDMKGLEQTSAWLSNRDYLFLAYSMSGKALEAGKHAVLNLGKAKISNIRLSDRDGHNVQAIGNEETRVNRLTVDAHKVPGIYSLSGQKVSANGDDLNRLPKGVYIINGKKVVK